MRVCFWVALLLAVVCSTQAAKADVDSTQPAAVEEEHADKKVLHARDGQDEEENNEHGGRGDKDGGWENDGESKVEVIYLDENNSKHGGGDHKQKQHVEYVGSGSKNIKYEHKNEKNEKNDQYEKKEEPKSEYGKVRLSGLAQVIPANHHAPTLDQIYKMNKQKNDGAYGNPHYNTPYGYQAYNNRLQVLESLKFGRDFARFDPRNNNSQWEFAGRENATADNAAYVVHHEKKSCYKTSAYGEKKDHSYVVQYSLPFDKYYESSDPNNEFGYYEGSAQTKANFTIGSSERLLVRAKFSCKIVNADKNPFPASQVSNPWDDPRLANCGLDLDNTAENNLLFFFSVTNTGVWANYQRGPSNNGNSTAQNFYSKRRVGVRQRYDTVVDAAIEIDRRQGVANFYLNGYLVWSIYAIGVPPPDDGVTSISVGQGEPQIATVTSVKAAIGTYKGLDEKDPNNQYSKTPLVRVLGNSAYYGVNDTFYDENNRKSNQLWGQGVIMTLLKLIVLRTESIPPPQVVLPGVYGAEQTKYQPAYHP